MENSPFEVLLSSEEIAWGMSLGSSRQLNALQAHQSPTWAIHYEQALARFAFFKAVDRFPGKSFKFDFVHISLTNPTLIDGNDAPAVVKRKDVGQGMVVFVQPLCPMYRVFGYLMMEDFDSLATFVKSRNVYVVNREDMRPINELYRQK